MTTPIELTAADGHRFAAWQAAPEGRPRGGVVLIHEIFGVTEQMKRCAGRFAAAGYLAVLPAMFDRRERGLLLGYRDFQKGAALVTALTEPEILADVEAARGAAAAGGATACIGYCWGGTVAYLAACNLKVACAVAYYGTGIGRLTARMQPKVPVLYHFGAEDRFIPPATIEQIRKADPGGALHSYEGAGHGFSCDDRESYAPAAASLAEERTLAFLAEHLGSNRG